MYFICGLLIWLLENSIQKPSISNNEYFWFPSHEHIPPNCVNRTSDSAKARWESILVVNGAVEVLGDQGA